MPNERLEELREIVADVLEVEPEELTDDGDFQEEYEADSLRAIEILARLDKALWGGDPAGRAPRADQPHCGARLIGQTRRLGVDPVTRVVVTGLGPVSSIGIGATAYEHGLRSGASGIGPVTSFDASGFPHRNAGEIADFDPRPLLTTLVADDWGRTSQFAAAAGRLAVTDAGLDPTLLGDGRAGVAMGTTSGESVAIEQVVAQIVDAGLPGVSERQWTQLPAQHLAEATATELGLDGRSITIATACSASNYAIGYGYDLIDSGEVDVDGRRGRRRGVPMGARRLLPARRDGRPDLLARSTRTAAGWSPPRAARCWCSRSRGDGRGARRPDLRRGARLRR